MRSNYKLQRLYCDTPLFLDAKITIEDKAAHYLKNVLRMKEGDAILLFNGNDGEWLGKIETVFKKHIIIALTTLERVQPKAFDFIYCFAPIKTGRLEYMVQKAVEMGVSVIQPVITDHTQIRTLNRERIEANIIEAAEQCGVLAPPIYKEPIGLEKLLQDWQSERHLLFCDEAANTHNPIVILQKLQRAPLGLLIGPEGGFSDKERKILLQYPFVITLPLGPRILRADTAAIAALAVTQAILGDWQDEQ